MLCSIDNAAEPIDGIKVCTYRIVAWIEKCVPSTLGEVVLKCFIFPCLRSIHDLCKSSIGKSRYLLRDDRSKRNTKHWVGIGHILEKGRHLFVPDRFHIRINVAHIKGIAVKPCLCPIDCFGGEALQDRLCCSVGNAVEALLAFVYFGELGIDCAVCNRDTLSACRNTHTATFKPTCVSKCSVAICQQAFVLSVYTLHTAIFEYLCRASCACGCLRCLIGIVLCNAARLVCRTVRCNTVRCAFGTRSKEIFEATCCKSSHIETACERTADSTKVESAKAIASRSVS